MADPVQPQTGQPQSGAGNNKNPSGEITAEDLLALWGMQPGSTPKQAAPSPSPASPPAAPTPALAPIPTAPPAPPPLAPSQPPRPIPMQPIMPIVSAAPVAPQLVLPPAQPVPPPPIPRPSPSPAWPPVPPRPTAPLPSPVPPRPAAPFSPPPVRPTAPSLAPEPHKTPPPPPKTPPPPPKAPSFSPSSEAAPSYPGPKPKQESKNSPVLEGEIVDTKTDAKAAKIAEEIKTGAEKTEHEFEHEEGGFGERFDEFLHELNLSRGSIFKAIGCLIGLVALGVGGFYGWRYYKNKKSPAPPPKEPTEIAEEETGIPSTGNLGDLARIIPALQSGILAVTTLGVPVSESTSVTSYILTFAKVQNAYDVALPALLDQSTDRRARLQSHLNLLKKLYEDSQRMLAKLSAESAALEKEYEPHRQAQEVSEENFFTQLDALNADTAEQLLQTFIAESKDVVAIRARFKVLQRIKSLYEKALPRVQKRIKDIELNQEALISGTKIYDVAGSDVDLIVPINGGGRSSQSPSGNSATPSFPFIPTSPQDVKTDRDFITQPGGGF